MLRKASASSSNGTSTTFNDEYHLSILRWPLERNSRSDSCTPRFMRLNPGCAWSPVFATARSAPSRSSAARKRATRSAGRKGESQGTVTTRSPDAWARPRSKPARGPAKPSISSAITRWPKRAYASGLRLALTRSSSTCGARRSTACATIGFPRKGCRPLSTPPMRLPCPPASTTPVILVMGEGGERRPLRALPGERVHGRHAVHRRHEERERQVHLVGPVVVLRLEGEPRAAARAELAAHAFRRRVVADELRALHEFHLRALEADPRDDARSVRGAAAPAIAMRAEARGKGHLDLDRSAMAAGLSGLRHGPSPSPVSVPL